MIFTAVDDDLLVLQDETNLSNQGCFSQFYKSVKAINVKTQHQAKSDSPENNNLYKLSCN